MHIPRPHWAPRLACAIAIASLVYACGSKTSSVPVVTAPAPPTTAPLSVDDFGLHDQRGDFHSLYYHDDAPAIVLYVQGNGCPIVRNGVATLDALRAEYEPRGVIFLMLNANSQDDRSSVAEETAAYGIDYPVLIDETQLVARSLGIDRTGEVLVVLPGSWEVAYRGPIDDRLD